MLGAGTGAAPDRLQGCHNTRVPKICRVSPNLEVKFMYMEGWLCARCFTKVLSSAFPQQLL